MDTAQFPPGQMLDGKYRIDRLLSVGGMGAVYLGTHTLLKKTVAIKVLRTELVGAVEMVERFQREAVAASAIGHENIVTITDMGKTEGGVAFLVMEYLEGRNLEDAIQEAGPFACATACDVACEILAGVAAAHRTGIVHRDLKPANVFLVRRKDGREAVKLLDFGIAILSDSEKPEHRLTMTGMVLGTPHYMAPEQARGDKEITDAVDIYAVGVMLYEMLCKRVPYDGENYNVLIYQVLAGEYAPPSVHRPDLPPGLEEIILKAMALKPWDRFLSADEFIEALEPYSSGQRSSPSLRIPVQSPRPARNDRMATSETLASPGTGEIDMGATPNGPTLAPGIGTRPAAAAHAAGLSHAGSPAYDLGQTIREPPTLGSTQLTSARSSPLRIVIPLLVLPVIAGLVLALVWPSDEAGPTAEPVVPAPAAGSEPQPATPADVVIDFQVTPANATVLVAGQPVSNGTLTLPAGTTALPVRIEAEGYEPYEGKLVPVRSQTMTVPLLQKPAVEPGPGEGEGAGEPGPRSGARTPDKGDKGQERTPDRPRRPRPERIITDDPYSN